MFSARYIEVLRVCCVSAPSISGSPELDGAETYQLRWQDGDVMQSGRVSSGNRPSHPAMPLTPSLTPHHVPPPPLRTTAVQYVD